MTRMQGNGAAGRRFLIGSRLGITFDVAAQSPDDAHVDLSVACMFEHEAAGASLSGGLLQLDAALGGALTSARASGSFRGHLLDSLLVTSPPSPVQAQAILVVGLGDPQTLDADALSRACAFAVTQAERMRAVSAAFAPNLLDAGIRLPADFSAARHMLSGAFSALALSDRLETAKLAVPSLLRHWSFDAGAAHFDAVADEFANAFAASASQAASDARDNNPTGRS